MDGNRVKKMLAEGQVTMGSWLSFFDPTAAEIMADVGFDWLIIDSEHAPIGPKEMQDIVMAFKGSDTSPIVRVGWNDQVLIKTALDLGAEGVMVPLVNTGEEARQAVVACKYPPEGIRGVGPRRPAKYGATLLEYMEAANEDVLVTVQIESIQAVEHIEEILAVEGVDTVFVGQGDLTGSMGLLPQFEHPKVREAINRVLEACLRAKVPFGVAALSEDEAADWISRGAQFVAFGGDIYYMRDAAVASLEAVKGQMERK